MHILITQVICNLTSTAQENKLTIGHNECFAPFFDTSNGEHLRAVHVSAVEAEKYGQTHRRMLPHRLTGVKRKGLGVQRGG